MSLRKRDDRMMQIDLSLNIEDGGGGEEPQEDLEVTVADEDQQSDEEEKEEEEEEEDVEEEEEEEEEPKKEDERLQGDKSMQENLTMYELSLLQTEMKHMKEENKLLRKVIERAMKDYYDLQMKFAAVQQQQDQQQKDPQIFLSLGAGGGFRESKGDRGGMDQLKSQMTSSEVTGEAKGLGLSLRLQTSVDTSERDDEATEVKKREQKNYVPLLDNYKQQTSGSELAVAGITSQSINPVNRKTRVSVRARCQGPTVGLVRRIH